jgi:hypothetical protein
MLHLMRNSKGWTFEAVMMDLYVAATSQTAERVVKASVKIPSQVQASHPGSQLYQIQ